MIPSLLVIIVSAIGEPVANSVNYQQTIIGKKVNQKKSILITKINEIIENFRENNCIPNKTTTNAFDFDIYASYRNPINNQLHSRNPIKKIIQRKIWKFPEYNNKTYWYRTNNNNCNY